MKAKLIIKIFCYLILIGIFASCSKLGDVPPAPEITTHNKEIQDTGKPGFHSNLVVDATNGMFDCQQCHGADWSGGITGVSCNTADCHPSINVHVEEILDINSDGFHGNFIRQNGWKMMDCQNCHGEDYGGGVAAPTCLDCHTQPEGPEACNTCHGNFNNPSIIAPPQDTNNNTNTESPGVGAHVLHLYQNDLGMQIPCSTCHIVPQNYADPGHVIDDSLPAEVVFSPLAIHNVANNPTYDYATRTCSDTYCHGNWEFLKDSADVVKQFAYLSDKIVGNNASIVWNQVGSGQTDCGTCHNLPPNGHLDHPACYGCHPGVVDSDRNIIDPEKHVNGEKNVFGN